MVVGIRTSRSGSMRAGPELERTSGIVGCRGELLGANPRFCVSHADRAGGGAAGTNATHSDCNVSRCEFPRFQGHFAGGICDREWRLFVGKARGGGAKRKQSRVWDRLFSGGASLWRVATDIWWRPVELGKGG